MISSMESTRMLSSTDTSISKEVASLQGVWAQPVITLNATKFWKASHVQPQALCNKFRDQTKAAGKTTLSSLEPTNNPSKPTFNTKLNSGSRSAYEVPRVQGTRISSMTNSTQEVRFDQPSWKRKGLSMTRCTVTSTKQGPKKKTQRPTKCSCASASPKNSRTSMRKSWRLTWATRSSTQLL